MSTEVFHEDTRGFEKDSVGIYLDDISKVPLLDAQREVELAKTMEAGLYAGHLLSASRENGEPGATPDVATQAELEWIAEEGERAKQEFISANLRLVVSIARKYGRSQIPLPDIIQEGNTGLVRAVEKFDYTKGYKFSTYATWWVRQAITRGIAQQSRVVRLPVHVVEEINQVNGAKRRLLRDFGREPEPEEIATELGLKVDHVLDLLNWAREHRSLDTPIEEGGSVTLGDLVAQKTIPGPDEVVMQREGNQELSDLIDLLDERAADIVRLRNALVDGRVHRLADIGEKWGVSAERVRQIERESVEKLRRWAGEPSRRPAASDRSETEIDMSNIVPTNRGPKKLLNREEFAMLEELLFAERFDPRPFGLQSDELLAAKLYARSRSVARVSRELSISASAAKHLVEGALNVLRPEIAEATA